MKNLLILGMLLGSALLADAQKAQGTAAQAGKNNGTVKKTSAEVRGSGQYHGSKDTTPGSPMGTGGAGGGEMSGSPAGSASKAAMSQSRADAQRSDSGNNLKKASPKRKGS
jgi:hypothetical protein